MSQNSILIPASSLHALTKNLFRPMRPRTHQPVRRSSYQVGEREGRLWRQHNLFDKSEHNARMRAAEEFDRATKAPGKRNGALGHIGLEVLRFLLRLRNRKNGRLDPSYTWLAAQLKRSRSAVATALARLRLYGFIAWIRRTQLTDDPSTGQYVEQASNAYYFAMPTGLAEFVARIARRPTEAQLARFTAARREQKQPAELDDVIAGIENGELRSALRNAKAALENASPPGGQNEAL